MIFGRKQAALDAAVEQLGSNNHIGVQGDVSESEDLECLLDNKDMDNQPICLNNSCYLNTVFEDALELNLAEHVQPLYKDKLQEEIYMDHDPHKTIIPKHYSQTTKEWNYKLEI